MKNIIFKISILIFTLIIFSCNSNDDSISRSGPESILVYLDGSPTALDFSYNINATDIPLPPQTGFSNMFTIQSEDVGGNPFQFNLAPTNLVQQTITTPSNESINGPISNRLQISGVTFDDGATNSLNVDYITFGNNVGDDIDITITGAYFDTFGSHAIRVEIHVHRD